MPTTERYSFGGPTSDYATLAALNTAVLAGRNLVAEDVTIVAEAEGNTTHDAQIGVGTTFDATHRFKICGGAEGVDDGLKPKSLLFGGVGLYGSVALPAGAVVDFEDLFMCPDVSGSSSIRITGAGVTYTIKRCVFRVSRNSSVLDDQAGGVFAIESALVYGVGTSSIALVWFNTGCTATGAIRNAKCYGGGYGVRRVAGTITVQNVYALASATADFSGTLTDGGGNTSEDGTLVSAGLAAVSEAAFARVCRRRADLLAYGTFDEAPEGATGKHRQSALFREEASKLWGTLNGNAAISGGLLTGTTGYYALEATGSCSSVNAMGGAIVATFPAAPVSRGLFRRLPGAGSNNRIEFYIDAAGKLTADWYNNAGTPTQVQYTPDADQLAGTHTFETSCVAGAISIKIDGVEVATGTLTGARDAAAVLGIHIGVGTGGLLGTGGSASCWGFFSAAAAPSLPLPLYGDLTGALDLLALSPLSSAYLKNSGTAAGAPTRGGDWLPLADRRRFDESAGHSIGDVGYHPTATPGGDKWGAGLISGDVVALPGPVYP